MNIKQRLRHNALDPRDPDYDGFEDWEEIITERIENDLLTEGEADYFMGTGCTYTSDTITLLECINEDSIDPIDLNNMLMNLLRAKTQEEKIEALKSFTDAIKKQINTLAGDAANEETSARIKQAERGEGDFSNEP